MYVVYVLVFKCKRCLENITFKLNLQENQVNAINTLDNRCHFSNSFSINCFSCFKNSPESNNPGKSGQLISAML